jgi:broad specificity phosphatase PhoE
VSAPAAAAKTPDWVRANRLFGLERLNFEPYLIRHGRSTANDQDLIVSDGNNGCDPRWGLSPAGQEQTHASALEVLRTKILDGSAEVYSSPFSRAQETARCLCEVAGIAGFTTAPELCERFFGELNLTRASTGYPRVWALDANDPAHTAFGVESVLAVSERVSGFFLRLHRQLAGRESGGRLPRVFAILHGDTGQIAECVLRRENPAGHRSLPPLRMAEIRRVPLR